MRRKNYALFSFSNGLGWSIAKVRTPIYKLEKSEFYMGSFETFEKAKQDALSHLDARIWRLIERRKELKKLREKK
jgi:hypothetical protein